MISEWSDPDDAQVVQVLSVNRDAGSIVLFDAVTLPGRPCLVAADHRAAQDLVNKLAQDDGPVYGVFEMWQFLG